jgi:glycosyltransferase involved in cell wall biosynthesis
MKIIGLLQARNEERFIRGWLENIAPAVDGIVALDDGSTDETCKIISAHPKTLEVIRRPAGMEWNEYINQVSLIKAGRRYGAEWFLCLDADERIEERLGRDIRSLLIQANARKVDAFSFHLRDLWNDRFNYRVDGIWANRARFRLFRNVDTHTKFDPRRLHRHWLPLEILTDIENVGVAVPYAIYHLRMISLEDRIARYERYTKIDPNNRSQPQGYSHLIDENDLELVSVPLDRDFLPKNDHAIS